MGRLLQFARGPVAQQDLEILLALDDQIRTLQYARDAESCESVTRLMHDGSVEPGQHTAALQDDRRGSGHFIRLVLDGRLIE